MATFDEINQRACAAFYRRSGVQPCSASTDYSENCDRVYLSNATGFLAEYRVSDIPYTDRVRLSFVKPKQD